MDVSLILNLHKESLYLVPTLNSLSIAANIASEFGLKIEIVIVMDNPDQVTKAVIGDFDFSAFLETTVSEVNYNSLGLSKNEGIQLATGKYIFTAGADDLISKNSIKDFFQLAEKYDSNNAFFMNYVIGFGQKYYVAKFLDSDFFNPKDFIANNTFTSRIFASRNLLLSYPYKDIPRNSGYAFEDWDLNNRLFADGINLRILSESVLFYRTREDALLSQATSREEKIVPQSKLHSCSYLIEKNTLKEVNKKQITQRAVLSEIISNPVIREYIYESIDLEPTILIDLVKSSPDWSPKPVQNTHWSSAFVKAIQILNQVEFTDVVLLQTLNPGGAENYIFQILDSIKNFEPNTKVLLISLDNGSKHKWINKLEPYHVFIDLRNMFPYLTESDFSKLLVNLLLAVTNDRARLHMKTFVFGQSFYIKYKKVLHEKLQIIYYRFSDSNYKIGERQFRDGHIISFLRATANYIDLIFTDNKKIISQDAKIFGESFTKIYSKISSYIEPPIVNWGRKTPSSRILWASRICLEKRPHLIPLIMNLVYEKLPDVSLDMYGSNELPEFIEELSKFKYITYKGKFDGFKTLPINNYDLLIYTSVYDGVPNVLIEALSTGIPVIAPDVGGISEILGDEFELIENFNDDLEMAKHYSNYIFKFYNDWQNQCSKHQILKNTLEQNYSKENHRYRVREVLVDKNE